MNLRHEFNRIGGILHNGVEKSHAATEDWAERQTKRANGMAKKVRDQVDFRSLIGTEEKIVQHVRENPALYLMGAALIIGALLAKLLMGSRETREAPLL